MAERAGFWNIIAKRYARTPVADEAAYQEKLRQTRERLLPEWEVFEFGCGTGTTAVHHAPHVKHIHALDVSPRMLAIARDRAREAGVDNISFEEGGIAAWPPRANAFDAVLGMSILHLVDDPAAIIAKVFAMLKPGGLFFSSTTCMGKMSPVLRAALGIGHALRLLPLLTRFTEAELLEMMRAAGFEIDHQWQPARGKALFVIARKPEAAGDQPAPR